MEIVSYTRLNWGDDQAGRYARRIDETIERIAVKPDLAAKFDHEGKQYLRKKIGSHAVFVRISSDRMTVVRILHVRMDARRHLS